MSPKLTRKLLEKYPDLFAEQNKSTISFGIEIDDGWFNIIHALSATITQYDNWHNLVGDERTLAIQVKEKFGGLRFYGFPSTEEIHGAIDMAEQMSFRMCETCGAPGQMHHKNNWLKTLCSDCAFNYNYILCIEGENE